ncbi:MAG: VWA domain-containing protein, partial [candidate division WOR-3 bacterium]
MGFAVPNLLPLVGLAALPVLIHLISRLRLRRADFPSLFLLQSVRRERFSWLRLKELLLLILRTLALTALLLSLTRPYLRRALVGLGTGQDLIVVIDDSYSMTYGSRWARAKEALDAIFNHLGRDQRVWILTGSQPDTARLLYRTQRSTIDSIKPSYTSATLERSVAKAVQLARAERAAVLVITDLQERALPATIKTPQDLAVTLIDVGESDFANAGIAGVRANNRLNARNLEVTIANYSRHPVTRVVSCEWRAASPGGEWRTGEEKVVPLKPQDRKLVDFAAPAEPATIRFQLEEDSLEPDNSRYWVLPQSKETPVLVVQSSEEAAGFLAD